MTHRYLICDKSKSKEKRHSRICQERERCGWLRFDENGEAQCDFIPKAAKRVNEYKTKQKEKKNHG